MTITEFLLARIAEDEAASSLVLIASVDASDPRNPQIRHRAIRERVLAECEAKRRIVQYRIDEGYADDGLVTALRALASVYADHPDFDPAWT